MYDKTKVAGIGTVALPNRPADSEAGGSGAAAAGWARAWRALVVASVFSPRHAGHDGDVGAGPGVGNVAAQLVGMALAGGAFRAVAALGQLWSDGAAVRDHLVAAQAFGRGDEPGGIGQAGSGMGLALDIEFGYDRNS